MPPDSPPSRLPLPVARLRRRAHNAKSSKDRHDTAYFAWEVSLRLSVAARPPADRSQLARGSVGQWVQACSLAEGVLQQPELLALFARLSEAGTGTRSERRSLAPRELLAALPAYRNKVIGHGSTRTPSFYEEAGRELLAGLDAAWEAGLFLPREARLCFVESVSVGALGEHTARVLDLSGDAAVVLHPQGTPVQEGLRPQRMYLVHEARWLALHPWLVFLEETERVLFFNGLGRRAEYLDYSSGETLSGDALERTFPRIETELRALFEVGSSHEGAEAAEAPIQGGRRFGDYTVLGKIGQGGMGAVYLARQASLERNVALKVLPQERAGDPVARARFQREIRALSRCEHPNVIKILASGEERGTLYYAMEYVEGADLARIAHALSSTHDLGRAVSSAVEGVLQERREIFQGLPEVPRGPAFALEGEDRHRQVARLFLDAARGLAHLHENGVLHRDISPANLMVTWPEGRTVVMDLGLAAVANASTLTKDKSQILGTLRYMAPERLAQQSAEIDARADVYSLGASLYELLTDRPFFTAETEAQLLEQVLNREPVPIEKLAGSVPRDLAIVCEKACAKDPAQRYAGAAALASDLERFLAGQPISARPPTLGYRLSKWAGRHRELAFAGAFGVLLAAAGGVYLLATGREAHQTQEQLDQTRLELERSARKSAHYEVREAIKRLVAEQEKLWPALGASLADLDGWLARARQVLDGDKGRPFSGRESILASMRELEQRGTELDAAEREAARKAHARFAEMQRKEQRCAELAYARDMRLARLKGRERPEEPAAWKSEPDWTRLPSDPERLNEQAWTSYVGSERKSTDQPRLGWWLARRALDLAGPQERWRIYDTLAWACYRLGQDEEAQRQGQLALEEAPADGEPIVRESQRKLAAEIEAASKDGELARAGEEIERLRRNLAEITAEIEADTRYRFADPADADLYRFYVELQRQLVLLADPKSGLIAGVHRDHGQGVQLRRDFAASIEERSRSGADARRRWDEALASIRDPSQCPAYHGQSALTPQLGLLPLRRDPQSRLWEFVYLQSGEAPEIGAEGRLVLGEATGLVLVLVPAGSFRMGSSNDPASPVYDRLAYQDERPDEPVSLDAFFLSKYEMTQAQWKHLVDRNPSLIAPPARFGANACTLLDPVENVSYDQCLRVLRRIGLTLPTEAQWEYAARAGTSSAWWTGDEVASLQGAANVLDRSCRADSRLAGIEVQAELDDGWVAHAPVGSFRANAFGLHDTAGNVWEWCLDRYGAYGAPRDPHTGHNGLDPTLASQPLIRGGGWFTLAMEARSARRNYDTADYRAPTLGLRPARAIER